MKIMKPVLDRNGNLINAADYVKLNNGQIRQVTAVVASAQSVHGMYEPKGPALVIAEDMTLTVNVPANLFYSGSVEVVPAPTDSGNVACGIVWGT